MGCSKDQQKSPGRLVRRRCTTEFSSSRSGTCECRWCTAPATSMIQNHHCWWPEAKGVCIEDESSVFAVQSCLYSVQKWHVPCLSFLSIPPLVTFLSPTSSGAGFQFLGVNVMSAAEKQRQATQCDSQSAIGPEGSPLCSNRFCCS